jgi:hypothetical protein
LTLPEYAGSYPGLDTYIPSSRLSSGLLGAAVVVVMAWSDMYRVSCDLLAELKEDSILCAGVAYQIMHLHLFYYIRWKHNSGMDPITVRATTTSTKYKPI